MLLLNFKHTNLIDYIINGVADSLATNNGVAIYAKHQLRLQNVFKLQVVNQLNAANASIFTKIDEDIVSIATFSGELISLGCFEINAAEQSVMDRLQIEIVEKFSDLTNTQSQSNNLLLLLVYGASNSHQLKALQESIESGIAVNLRAVEFRFTNNIPATIFYTPLSPSHSGSNNSFIPGLRSQRRRIALPRNTYSEILKNIADEIRRTNSTIRVGELMDRFEHDVEKRLREILKDEEEVKENMNIFTSINDSGARRAQVLLRITNEKTRVHFSKNIKEDQNLFTYCEDYESKNVKFSDRFVRSYDPNDSYIMNQPLYLHKDQLS
jgi:hypothetical protein